MKVYRRESSRSSRQSHLSRQSLHSKTSARRHSQKTPQTSSIQTRSLSRIRLQTIPTLEDRLRASYCQSHRRKIFHDEFPKKPFKSTSLVMSEKKQSCPKKLKPSKKEKLAAKEDKKAKNREKQRAVKRIELGVDSQTEAVCKSKVVLGNKKRAVRISKNKILHKTRKNLKKIAPIIGQIRAERIREKYNSYRKRKEMQRRRWGGMKESTVDFNVELDMYDT